MHVGIEIDREYGRGEGGRQHMQPFPLWLRDRCATLAEATCPEQISVRAMSWLPSSRVCSFRSMSAYGSHFRLELDGGAPRHVTFDSGVAELECCTQEEDCSGQGGVVKLLRVGILKDILVLNYVNVNIVLMVVSWVAKDTEMQPQLRRDEHGFWLANMVAVPRCTKEPYILPSLASQVHTHGCRH